MVVYDITINGSLVAQGKGADINWALWDAYKTAVSVSRQQPTRLVRLHDLDGEVVLSEYRNGRMVQR